MHGCRLFDGTVNRVIELTQPLQYVPQRLFVLLYNGIRINGVGQTGTCSETGIVTECLMLHHWIF